MAARFATVHFDVAGHPSTYDRDMWFVDRLHPNERGHRVLARGYCALLELPEEQWPGAEPSSPPVTRRAQVGWMATKGTRWMIDRSQDLLPYLMRMMVAEWWYGLRNRSDQLDTQIAQETELVAKAYATPPYRTVPQPQPPAQGGAAAGQEPTARLEPWLAPMDAPLTNSDR